ncbi:MAG: alpha/beta fold hydrolase [Anaerolinea sp.]|nr:alpha/beta fold hydrolase [Anaerolinea sp.]
MTFASAFKDPKHHAFTLTGTKGVALLVHGFPGSPAEMRPLAEALNKQGWTVRVILLPGFGAEIEKLPRRGYTDWMAAVGQALLEMKVRGTRPLLVVGHSMGGSLAINAATQIKPEGLIVYSPFTRLDHPLWRLLPLISMVVKSFNPFTLTKIDFDDPQTRAGMHEFMPDANLDDPAVRAAILKFKLPTSVLLHIRKAGMMAVESAPEVKCQTLIVQGTRDPLVSAQSTKELLPRFGNRAVYHEVDAEHNLLDPALPAWQQVERITLEFTAMLLR